MRKRETNTGRKPLSGFESEQRHVPNTMSRRDSLKWLSLITAGGVAAVTSGVSSTLLAAQVAHQDSGHWPAHKLTPVSAKGYGKDPNLIMPPETPWPLIMTANELVLITLLCDIIVPKDGNTPSATELQVPAVINEWVSAPYDWQQRDRVTIMHLLAWLNDEAKLEFQLGFSACSRSQQIAIIDNIAYLNDTTPPQFSRPAQAFGRLRELVLAAFFTTPAGMKDIGYLGNVPINGDYPGPTEEAFAHLDNILDELGLSEYKYNT